MAKNQANGQNGAFDFGAFALFFDPKQFAKQFEDNAFTKAFAANGIDFAGLAQSQQKTFEAWTGAQKAMVEAAQQVGKRQVEMTREAFDQGSQVLSDLAAAQTPAEKVRCQMAAVKAAYEKGLASAEELGKISVEANQKASKMIAKRVSESLDELATQVETAQDAKAA